MYVAVYRTGLENKQRSGFTICHPRNRLGQKAFLVVPSKSNMGGVVEDFRKETLVLNWGHALVEIQHCAGW